ncbi:MAG: rRNA maturation RNase YbeY [Magnetococcales bacterium]|nr:rRNA maturation RNase YbeY [Magnetococcales bacterium]
MTATVRVVRVQSPWPKVEPLVRKAARVTLDHLGGYKGAEIDVRLTNDSEVQELNHRYRGIDRPTNILSFAMLEEDEDGQPPEAPLWLGDLVIAYETVAREADEQGKTFSDHLMHLVVHGVLHLVGHDHEKSPEDELLQETMEIAILSRLGITNPYEE